MVVQLAIGLVGAVPFVSLLAIWKRRKPSRTAAVGHIALAGVASIAAMIMVAAVLGLEGPAAGLVVPPVIAGAVVGQTAKQRGLLRPDSPAGTGTR